jgi:hypothetical protein
MISLAIENCGQAVEVALWVAMKSIFWWDLTSMCTHRAAAASVHREMAQVHEI